jgi:putative DNA primase/helicase
LAAEVKLLELPGLGPKQDVSDWLARGGTAAELERLADEPSNPSDSAGARRAVPLQSSNLNDLYHARRIAQRFGQSIRHCERLGGFFVYDGVRWTRDETAQVWRWAVETAEDIQREARGFGREDERRRLLDWAARAERRANVESALTQLAALEGIALTHDAFDRDPWLLNCANGTLDLRSGELRPHRREDMLTKMTAVRFEPKAPCPQWQAFLTRIMGGNVELLAFLQRAVGYALTGSVREQKLLFLHGTGANGKSTFLSALLHVWGDYGRRIAPDLLFFDRDDTHPTALADLCGVRLAVTTEVEQGKRLAEVLVKQLSGGDRLLARRMRQDYFEFEPTHKLFMAGNHLPVIRGTDHAVWRRIALVPFTVTVPEGEQIKDLADKLRAEAPGIFRWCVRGCLDWQAFGLSEPAEVRAATGQYRSDMDILGDFLAERCVVLPGAEVTSAELNQAYRAWCEKTGERAMSARSLGLRLKERGFTQKHSGESRARTWMGIGLGSEG